VPYVAELYRSLSRMRSPTPVLSIERTFWEKATILHAKPTAMRPRRRRDDSLGTMRSRRVGGSSKCSGCSRARRTARAVSLSTNASSLPRLGEVREAVPGTFRLIPPRTALRASKLTTATCRDVLGRPTSWRTSLESSGAGGANQPALKLKRRIGPFLSLTATAAKA